MKPPHLPLAQRSAAFSLVEILVSVAIIAVLFSLALPVFRGVQQRARITQSMHNLREIGIVAQLYANENDGAYPVVFNGPTWSDILWSYLNPGGKVPGLGVALKGTIFYSPLQEKDSTRSYGMNLTLEKNYSSRRYQQLPNGSKIALFGDTAISSTLSTTQINLRNAGRAGVVFVDGHVDLLSKQQIPSKDDPFWTGKM